MYGLVLSEPDRTAVEPHIKQLWIAVHHGFITKPLDRESQFFNWNLKLSEKHWFFFSLRWHVCHPNSWGYDSTSSSLSLRRLFTSHLLFEIFPSFHRHFPNSSIPFSIFLSVFPSSHLYFHLPFFPSSAFPLLQCFLSSSFLLEDPSPSDIPTVFFLTAELLPFYFTLLLQGTYFWDLNGYFCVLPSYIVMCIWQILRGSILCWFLPFSSIALDLLNSLFFVCFWVLM